MSENIKYYVISQEEINQFASFEKCIDYYIHDFLANYEHRNEIYKKHGYADFKKELIEVLRVSEHKWIQEYDPENIEINDYRFNWEVLKGTIPLIVKISDVVSFLENSYNSFMNFEQHNKLKNTERKIGINEKIFNEINSKEKKKESSDKEKEGFFSRNRDYFE